MSQTETKETKEKDWAIPDAEGNINVPDELYPLFNSVGFQMRFVNISGKNEIIACAHIVQKAQEFFAKKEAEKELGNSMNEAIKILEEKRKTLQQMLDENVGETFDEGELFQEELKRKLSEIETALNKIGGKIK